MSEPDIGIFTQCKKCRKYTALNDDGANENREQFRFCLLGRVSYFNLPAGWRSFSIVDGKDVRQVLLCQDCLPKVLKELFP